MTTPRVQVGWIIGACEQAQTWEEARWRVLALCEEHAIDLADMQTTPDECIAVAKFSVWPSIVADRNRPIYLGYQFL